MIKHKMAAVALTLVAGAAGAATQGTLGVTSTGTFTNTFNGTTAQVQVLNLVDSVMTPLAANVVFANGNSMPGVQNNFCVVNTAGGATKLTFTSANPAIDTTQRRAYDSGGIAVPYILAVGVGNATSAYDSLSTTGFTVPAANAVTSAATCAAGNVTKQIVVNGGSPITAGLGIFVDTITVVATPI